MPRKNSIIKRNRAVHQDNTDTRVFFYARASTDGQKNSTAAQEQQAKPFAAARSIFIDTIVADEDSSAVKTNFLDRPKVRAMLSRMKQRSIRTILILRPDRIFRSTLDYAVSLKWLTENGYNLRFIDPDLDLDSPIGKMMVQIQVAFAEMECAIKTKRVDEALESMRDRRIARGNNPSYGWELTDEIAGTSHAEKPLYRLTPIQSEQTILRHIIHLWDTTEKKHGALSRIARDLNAMNIPTKMAGQTIIRHGTTHQCSGNWTAAAVKSVIEHAVIASPDELENPNQTLQQAIEQLTQKSLAA